MAQHQHIQQYHQHHYTLTAFKTLITIIGVVITVLLATRFVLSLMEVDRMAQVPSLIYAASYPLVAPFFAAFNYQQQMGVLRFEYQTLIAMVFWGLAAWYIAGSFNQLEE